MMAQLVLVTGSSGKIGQAIVAELLLRGVKVRGFDRMPSAQLPDAILGDLGDRLCLEAAMVGVSCVVHLAATPDDDDFVSSLLPNNILGLYHVMEAAKGAGVGRIVLASSGQVNWWRQLSGPFPIKEDEPVTPRGWYAATKMFMEAIGYGFTQMHEISVIIARLGWCPRPGQEEEIRSAQWAHDVYLSPADAGRFFACCVEAPKSVRYLLVNAASRPVCVARMDLGVARDLLGYVPRDTYPEGL